ncbi:MAG: glyceraldehyde 3-phosphate dehydrogenase NAD-binding domain-containing protein [Patescibacteria group bacterium]|nr:glyceraldehyde 3-phosphate dehydrogenase NAD-binding domain-containing protein [Patescibacteria group bacterium]
MKKVKVAVNGLGRIGRAFLKLAIESPDVEVLAVNDLGELDNFAYLLKYDSAYGPSGLDIKTENGHLVINGKRVRFLQEGEPSRLPWGELGIDVVLESTGVFNTYARSKSHLDAGAHKVVVSAPLKDEPVPGINGATVLMGINDDKLGICQISSNASCTTNSVSPVMQIMMDSIGVTKALLNTVHGYTASQKLVDGPDAKDYRRGRAAAQNIIPSTTGAAIAVTKALPGLAGLFDGIATRVPVITGSIADLTFVSKKDTSVSEVNDILKKAAKDPRWEGLFTITEEPLVSTDIMSSPYASIADLGFTRVVGGNLVKILAWYDNEIGYTHSLLKHVIKAGS